MQAVVCGKQAFFWDDDVLFRGKQSQFLDNDEYCWHRFVMCAEMAIEFIKRFVVIRSLTQSAQYERYRKLLQDEKSR